jgi:hypothetical protein
MIGCRFFSGKPDKKHKISDSKTPIDPGSIDPASKLGPDPGIEKSVEESVGWLGRAQDNSVSHDFGVARHYCLTTGWGPSYPETTGYIIPTLLTYGKNRQDEVLIRRARKMTEWLVSIQFPEGGFQGGTIDCRPVVPVAFNTGQILMGLAAASADFGDTFITSMHRAAEWLVKYQDRDGCWRKHSSPFTIRGDKTYDTHIAWGLLEAARVGHENKYAESALRNINWALTRQKPNGWFSDCCLTDPSQPLTHTLGYALRGVLEGYRYTSDKRLLEAGRNTGEGLLTAFKPDGFLPGRLNRKWQGTVAWACLTGSVQVAYCWLMLYQETGDERFRDAAFAVNRYARRTTQSNGNMETRGAVMGSFPISGDYGRYQYLNWAAKFFIDANLLELEVRKSLS